MQNLYQLAPAEQHNEQLLLLMPAMVAKLAVESSRFVLQVNKHE